MCPCVINQHQNDEKFQYLANYELTVPQTMILMKNTDVNIDFSKAISVHLLLEDDAYLHEYMSRCDLSDQMIENVVKITQLDNISAKQEKILKIAQIDPLRVEVYAPVAMLGKIVVGMAAHVKPEAPLTGEYAAKVMVVDRVVDAASGTFGVRLELPNRELKLPAGLKCSVRFGKKIE